MTTNGSEAERNIYHPMSSFYLGPFSRSMGTMRWDCKIHAVVKRGRTKGGTQLRCEDNLLVPGPLYNNR